MAKNKKPPRPKARLPKGLRDIPAEEIRARDAMLATIRGVYEFYGFEPLDTPAFEYTDALGKFLPDSDRPNEGVFSFQDEDEQWLSLRYDLTAPLADTAPPANVHLKEITVTVQSTRSGPLGVGKAITVRHFKSQ